MPVTRIRDLVKEHRVLARQVTELARVLNAHSAMIETLLDQIAENGLRTQFVFHTIQVRREVASPVILPGQPHHVVTQTLGSMYREQRESFLAKLEAEHKAQGDGQGTSSHDGKAQAEDSATRSAPLPFPQSREGEGSGRPS